MKYYNQNGEVYQSAKKLISSMLTSLNEKISVSVVGLPAADIAHLLAKKGYIVELNITELTIQSSLTSDNMDTIKNSKPLDPSDLKTTKTLLNAKTTSMLINRMLKFKELQPEDSSWSEF